MTRINTIKPSDILDQHLIAEWRELPRIPNSILSGKAKLDLKIIPDQYKLGQNHVRFFYNKLSYLQKRHTMICEEMDRRSINRDKSITVDLTSLNLVLKACLCNDWQPTSRDHNINIERLQERFDLRKRAYHLTTPQGKQVINCEHSFNEYLRKHLEKYM
ncbi:endonuclease V N-glycosylase UV repair enzyme [Vibrio phage 11895-B1]|uniref:endonuclease V N-glycosylase UV repair enzyme n=1 Tax=Vibrio phage 11895-B1 TaxID=754075 RepID=UPI0002C0A3CB|nr:endonuclease V N-glycosylase UV repair enzyme [Vibrio phage 11895-B1]AGH32114.1 DenV endonuclease V [Vibrio phage 11895-B1]